MTSVAWFAIIAIVAAVALVLWLLVRFIESGDMSEDDEDVWR